MAVPTVRVPAQIAYRTANWSSPLWATANLNGARFNHPNTAATQYLALHPLTAWAEQVRVRERQLRRPLVPSDLNDPSVFHRLWLIKIPELVAFDLNFDTAREVGLTQTDLVDDSQAACQEAGEKFRFDRSFPKVWRYPSAAIAGTHNLVIFESLRMTKFERVPAARSWPASLAAHAAHAPVEVLGMTSHLGNPPTNHASYRAWKAGTVVKLIEPSAFVWP